LAAMGLDAAVRPLQIFVNDTADVAKPRRCICDFSEPAIRVIVDKIE